MQTLSKLKIFFPILNCTFLQGQNKNGKTFKIKEFECFKSQKEQVLLFLHGEKENLAAEAGLGPRISLRLGQALPD